MKKKCNFVVAPLLWAVCVVLLSGCAGRGYLIVDYELPMATEQLKGKIVQLQVEDNRKGPSIMSLAARRHFESFKGRYSLAWIKPNTERVPAGEHDLTQLLQTTFEKRLDLMGATVTRPIKVQEPLLTITLDTFAIDYKGRKWIAEVGYRASLTKEGHPTTSQRIRGNAERIRIIGRKEADKVVNDLFTDAVNRLDIMKLFKNARLTP